MEINSDNWIYLIEERDIKDDDVLLYKIGVSKNPDKRLKNLKTGNSNNLSIKQLYKTNQKYVYKIETILHRIHENKKIAGEWFLLNDNDVENFLLECIKIEKDLKTVNIKFI